jgi:hypothetical protein
MSIFEETGQGASVTEGDRALQLFTDRHEAIRRFAEYLNDDPPKKQILFFYGDGGNGKSLLLKHLRERCCKRFNPDNWQYVRSLPDDELAEHLIHAEGADKDTLLLYRFWDVTARGGTPARGLLGLAQDAP